MPICGQLGGDRRVVARVHSKASDHPDVEELYRRAALLDRRISIATVYRTVRLLEERASCSAATSAAAGRATSPPSTATTTT